MKKTKKIAIGAMFSALCVAVLSLGSVVETLDLSLAILAGLVVMVINAEFSWRVASCVYLVAGLLALLLPAKTPALFFLAFFGWYPVAQKKIQLLSPVWARLLKEGLFNIFVVLFLAVSAFVTGTKEAFWVYAVLFVVSNIVFVIYDILLDRILLFYILKIRKRLGF